MSDFFNFGNAPVNQGGTSQPIPDGTLAKGVFTVRPSKVPGQVETTSKNNEANAYLDIEITIQGGDFDKRKVWDMIGVRGSEGYVNMGRAAIRAILEGGRGASPSNPERYQIQSFMDLDGLVVPIRINIEKGKGGHADKNRPTYLSPNPESSGYDDFQSFAVGKTLSDTANPAANPGAGQAAAGFGAPLTQQPANPGAGQAAGFGAQVDSSATKAAFGKLVQEQQAQVDPNANVGGVKPSWL